MRPLLRLAHPEPPRPRPRVLPVFLPFAGCPGRCLYCDQAGQTGLAPEPLEAAWERLAARLAALDGEPAGRPAPELAFYGGTFTSLPAPWPRRFLELARPRLSAGRIARVRCSTRPDAVDPRQLAELAPLGLSLVELGVQSFDDAALRASGRGYGGEVALAACRSVRGAGLGLGVQLLPGLPGQGREAFRQDIARTAELKPELARLYPCLVLEGSGLAGLWRAGKYQPWTLPETVEELAQALLELWAAGVAVARLGLAQQAGLTVLAGPRHPALGQMARSRALLSLVRRACAGLAERPSLLLLPRRLQGEALGQGGELAPDYAALGLSLAYWDEADLALAAR